MQMIVPIAVDNAVLEASNVPENDYPAWNSGTTYALDAFTMVTGSTHKIFKSTQGGNIGHNPVTDNGTYWTPFSATNRWKAFDRVLAKQVETADTITYSLRLPGLASTLSVSAVSVFNTEADSVRLQIFDALDVEIYDETVTAIQRTEVNNWYSFIFGEFDQSTEQLFLDQPGVQNLPGYAGYRADVTITRTGGTAKIGQLVLGRLYNLGATVEGTEVGLQDFSVKEQDQFGNVTLQERDFSREIDFEIVFPTAGAQRLDYLLSTNRATPVVFLAGPNTEQLATTVYGWIVDYKLQLAPENSRGRISVRGFA